MKALWRLEYEAWRPSGGADDEVRSRSASPGAARRMGGGLRSSRGSDVKKRRNGYCGDRRWPRLHDAVS